MMDPLDWLAVLILLLVLEAAFGLVWAILFGISKFLWGLHRSDRTTVSARFTTRTDTPPTVLRIADKAGWSSLNDSGTRGSWLLEKDGLVVQVGAADDGGTELAFLGATALDRDAALVEATVSRLLGASPAPAVPPSS